jgi:hypothetical protein
MLFSTCLLRPMDTWTRPGELREGGREIGRGGRELAYLHPVAPRAVHPLYDFV